jgi:hypothetical protein
MLEKKKDKSKGNPSARTATGWDEETGKSSQARFNPKVKKGANPSARTETGWDEETGKNPHPRYNPKVVRK